MPDVPRPPTGTKQLIEWWLKFVATADDVPEDPRTGEDYSDGPATLAGQRERATVAAREWRRSHRMVAYEAHTKLVLSGKIGNGRETFSLGLRGHFFHSDGSAGDLGDDAKGAWLAGVVQPAVVGFWGGNQARIHPTAVLTRITAASIGPDGKYTEPLPPFVATNVPGTGGGGNNATYAVSNPWQVALAVTLRAHLAKTSQGRIGRFYLPVPLSQPDAGTNAIPSGDAAAIGTAVKGMLDSINAGDTGDATLAWEFRLFGDGVRKNHPDSTGPSNRVDMVQVGNVLDTIRSRRNSGGEVYSMAQLA